MNVFKYGKCKINMKIIKKIMILRIVNKKIMILKKIIQLKINNQKMKKKSLA